MDTRETSRPLTKAAIKACATCCVTPIDYSLCTTPMVHWFVSNKVLNVKDKSKYVLHMSNAFNNFMKVAKTAAKKNNYEKDLLIDCSNGVGAPFIK